MIGTSARVNVAMCASVIQILQFSAANIADIPHYLSLVGSAHLEKTRGQRLHARSGQVYGLWAIRGGVRDRDGASLSPYTGWGERHIDLAA